MDISIRNAKKDDYKPLLFLFREVHDLHVSERPDLYKENSTPVSQEFYESQLNDDKQYIFVATIDSEIVGFVVMKEEQITESAFVNARKVLFINSLCAAEAQRKKGGRKKTYELCL